MDTYRIEQMLGIIIRLMIFYIGSKLTDRDSHDTLDVIRQSYNKI